ncbi:MAG: BREX system Lon protease-like protein BrxL [Nitrososphaerota archaeon]
MAQTDIIIPADKWWEAVKRSWQIQNEYGVSVDPAMILNVPDPIKVILGINKQLFNAARPESFISRPIGYQVKNGYIYVKYPNGVRAAVPMSGTTEEERIRYALKVARSWHVVALNKGGYAVKEIMDLSADTEAAKAVIDSVGRRRAVAMALGIKTEALDGYWHRATVLITKAHVMELSQPATGKSTYGWYISRVLGGIVVNEPPSVAFLAGDARDGSFGAAFTSNVIVFDEIDKWSRKGENMAQTMDVLLSGMENCVWARGAGKGLNYNKCVSTIWFGNTPSTLADIKDRAKIAELMTKIFKLNMRPLIDRISIIATEAPRFRTDYLGDLLKPVVVRGISRIMTEEAQAKWDELRRDWDARSAWHLAVIMTVLNWVKEKDVSIDDAIAVYNMP